VCGIGVEERKKFEENGCCHRSVEQQFQKLLEGSILDHFLCEMKDQQKVSQWKKEICNKVSIECMKNSKNEFEIKEQLKKEIENKIFG
jgi:hypothetical protein